MDATRSILYRNSSAESRFYSSKCSKQKQNVQNICCLRNTLCFTHCIEKQSARNTLCFLKIFAIWFQKLYIVFNLKIRFRLVDYDLSRLILSLARYIFLIFLLNYFFDFEKLVFWRISLTKTNCTYTLCSY